MRVLVVDDDGEFREALTSLLGLRGHRVVEAGSAEQAVTALEHDEFDVMFTDLRIGRVNGLELLAQGRERWPRLMIVVLTGSATIESAIRALQLGAFDYLRKPAQPAQVDRVLALVDQQLALTRSGSRPLDASRYASVMRQDWLRL